MFPAQAWRQCMLALSVSPISAHIFTVFGRHTSRFVVWGFESFLVSLKMGLFLCFFFVLLFVASGRFGGGVVWVRRKGVKMSLLCSPGYICDVHASTVSPSCALVGTGPHSQISDRILRFSQVLHICHIWRVSKLCRFNMGYQKVEWENCINAAPPSQNFLPNCELKVCVCVSSQHPSWEQWQHIHFSHGWLPSESMNFTLRDSVGLCSYRESLKFPGSIPHVKVLTGSKTESRCW